jgi:hypothetical protein
MQDNTLNHYLPKTALINVANTIRREWDNRPTKVLGAGSNIYAVKWDEDYNSKEVYARVPLDLGNTPILGEIEGDTTGTLTAIRVYRD